MRNPVENVDILKNHIMDHGHAKDIRQFMLIIMVGEKSVVGQ